MNKKAFASFLLAAFLIVPNISSATTLSDLYQQLNSISWRLAQLVQLFSLRNPASQLGQVSGAFNAPLSVDLKANGSDQLSNIKYDSPVTLSWKSVGASKCSAFGSLVPTTGGSLWNDLGALPATGNVQILAKHQTLGFSSPLQLTIQCANASGSTVRDTVELTVVK